MDRVNSAVGSLGNFVGRISDDELPEEESLLPQFGQGCSLTARQEIAASLWIRWLFKPRIVLFLSFFSGDPPAYKFAVTYTVSHWEGFLIGPKKQFNMMFDPVRILSTISIFLALFCALHLHDKLIEACALLWFSYIPFAQSAARRWLSKPLIYLGLLINFNAVCQF